MPIDVFHAIGKIRDEGEISNEKIQKSIWRKIWKSQLPNKVNLFAWRACKNGLPTLYNLKTRKVVLEDDYIFCKEEVEDTRHAFYSCPSIRECWKKQLNCLENQYTDSEKLVQAVMKTSTQVELEKLFLIARGMWYKRNQKIHEDKDLFPEQVVEYALSLRKIIRSFKVNKSI